jgi:hypothetical protein
LIKASGAQWVGLAAQARNHQRVDVMGGEYIGTDQLRSDLSEGRWQQSDERFDGIVQVTAAIVARRLRAGSMSGEFPRRLMPIGS